MSLVNIDGAINNPETYFNKTRMNKLRQEHNRVVKKMYRVPPDYQDRFDEWFINNCNGFDHIEITMHQTLTGNPYFLVAV